MRWGTAYWGRGDFGRIARGAKKFEYVAKRGANNFGHVVKGGPKNFRLDFFNVCGNNLYVVLGYYRHF